MPVGHARGDDDAEKKLLFVLHSVVGCKSGTVFEDTKHRTVAEDLTLGSCLVVVLGVIMSG